MRVQILGVPVDNLSFDEAVARCLGYLNTNKNHMLFTPNPEHVVLAGKDKEFREIINKGDLIVPDGIGLVLATRLRKNKKDRIQERVGGCDLTSTILEKVGNSKTVYPLPVGWTVWST